MAEITQLLAAARDGDDTALKRVFEDIYPELRSIAAARLASVRGGQTITPTALINETYLKFTAAKSLDLIDRRHFYTCASKAMRQILIDYARMTNAQRRGGRQQRVTLTEGIANEISPGTDFFDLNAALTDLLEIDKGLHDLVELKFFAGLSMPEIAELTERSLRTVNRDWSRARAFLHTQLAS